MDHDHCWKCIDSSCSSLQGCFTVSCPDCSVTLHHCKLTDHSTICQEKRVVCINVEYGCPYQIKKRLMCDHLSICPLIEDVKVKWEMTLCEYCLQAMPLTDITDHQLVCQDFPVSCTNVLFGCLKIFKRRDINVHLAHCPASITQCLYSYSRTGNNSKLSITKEDNKQLPDEKFFLSDQSDFTSFPLSFTPLRSGFYYPLLSDSNTLSKGNRLICNGSFVCGMFVRRDEFSSHWLSHIELIDDLSMKIQRCHLSSYGCQHGTILYQPSPEGHTFQYKEDYKSFVICPLVSIVSSDEGGGHYATEIAKKRELALYGYENKDEGSIDVLGQLPFEVLLHIMSHVDSLSLWSLSQVNLYFRNVCEDLLSSRGLVYFIWEKYASASWRQSGKYWCFSKVFSSTHCWRCVSPPSPCSHMCDASVDRVDMNGYVWDMQTIEFKHLKEADFSRKL